MHSSRMCTTRLLPLSPSMHSAWGGLLRGYLPLVMGGVCYLGEGVSPSGHGGVCLWSQGGASQHAMLQALPLWTEFLTHASENITLPQLRCGR